MMRMRYVALAAVQARSAAAACCTLCCTHSESQALQQGVTYLVNGVLLSVS